MKILMLRARGRSADGTYSWHDAAVLPIAIESIVRSKSFAKAAVWMGIAAKIELAREDHADEFMDGKALPELSVELRNSEARLLWRELCKLKPEQFSRTQGRCQVCGRNEPVAPPVGLLYLMLEDFARQLGKELPVDDEDEDDDEEE